MEKANEQEIGTTLKYVRQGDAGHIRKTKTLDAIRKRLIDARNEASIPKNERDVSEEKSSDIISS